MAILTIVLAIGGIFGERDPADSGSSSAKWLNSPTDCVKRLAGQVTEELRDIEGKVLSVLF